MDSMQPLAAVLFVLALLGGAVFFLKKNGSPAFRFRGLPPAGQRQLEVMERVPLGPQQAVYLVRAGRRFVLIGATPHSVQFLDMEISGEGKP